MVLLKVPAPCAYSSGGARLNLWRFGEEGVRGCLRCCNLGQRPAATRVGRLGKRGRAGLLLILPAPSAYHSGGACLSIGRFGRKV